MNHSNSLILFLKEPKSGKVKTRLGTIIGMDKSMSIYKEFLKLLSDKVIKSSWKTLVYYSASENPVFLRKTFGESSEYRPQTGSGMGDKMLGAFSACFNEGAGKVCIIGGDSPDIPSEFLSESFLLLDSHDIVLGPTLDGGYYLLGMNFCHRELFSNINWSTSSVYQETLEIIKNKGLTHVNLPPWQDVDTFEDFKIFKKKHPEFPVSISINKHFY